jgi:integrase/recombinase XerC
MLLVDAVETYVTGRVRRRDLRADSARQIRWRLATLAAACPPGMKVGDLDRAAVRDWQAAVAGWRPATRRAGLSAVRTFCRWALDEGLLDADPTAGLARIVEPRHETRALSPARVSRLMLVLPDLRARVIVTLMWGVGLRCCEVARLAVDDYEPDALGGAQIRVVGKGDHERCLPVAAGVAATLDEWLAARPAPGPLVGVSAGRISMLVSAWMGQAGLKRGAYDGVSAHALRHTFASDVLDRCGNVRTAQALLGHESLATTQRYLRKASMEQMRRAADPDWRPAARHHGG